MNEKYAKVGTCPWCGAPIYGLPREDGVHADIHYTCNCRELAIYRFSVPSYQITHPYQQIWIVPPAERPAPHSHEITCGDNTASG